jgi:hypothetical protein
VAEQDEGTAQRISDALFVRAFGQARTQMCWGFDNRAFEVLVAVVSGAAGARALAPGPDEARPRADARGLAVYAGHTCLIYGLLMMLPSSVTAPLWVSARPLSVAPVLMVIETAARMFPWKTEVVPRVAELPTAQ